MFFLMHRLTYPINKQRERKQIFAKYKVIVSSALHLLEMLLILEKIQVNL